MNIFENRPLLIFVTLAMATTCEELLSSSFAINSVVHGYHVYKGDNCTWRRTTMPT